MRGPTPHLTAWVAGDPQSLSRSLCALPVKNHLTSDSQAWLMLSHSKDSSFQPPSQPPSESLILRWGPGTWCLKSSARFGEEWTMGPALSHRSPSFHYRNFCVTLALAALSRMVGGCGGHPGAPTGVGNLGRCPAQMQGPLLPGPQVNYSSKMVCQVI